MQLINQEQQGAEGFTQEDDVWERCARLVGFPKEDLEKARAENAQGRVQSTHNPRFEETSSMVILEGLEGTGAYLGK